MSQLKELWNRYAGEWDLFGPPLRPCPEDITIMEGMVDRWASVACVAAPQAVILGVTGEIVAMRFPERTHILAFDREPAMIAKNWPRHALSNAAALCSDWLALPLVDGYADMVLADGSFTLLEFPGDYRKIAQELARILVPGGILAARLFVPPARTETVENVFNDLWGGRIENFNYFKWRLAMSLIDPLDFSVCVNDIWVAWHDHVSSAEKLSETLGWPLPVIRTIENHRGCDSVRYSYPPLEQFSSLMSPYFRPGDTVLPTYQDSERYPTVCLHRV